MSSLENALSLDSQVALVTGAAGGIGRATALALGQAGASIIATDRQETSDGLAETVQLIEKLERPVVAITADLATRSAIEELANHSEKIARSIPANTPCWRQLESFRCFNILKVPACRHAHKVTRPLWLGPSRSSPETGARERSCTRHY